MALVLFFAGALPCSVALVFPCMIFLLVPYVGACIHVPPPPANQIVYVTMEDAYISTDLFEPVWITGRMIIKATNQLLTYVDGTAGIDTAYTLKGKKIEPYEK